MTRYPLPPRPAIVRTMDATLLNTVANDPTVRPWLGGDGPINLAPLLADPTTLAIVTPHGGIIAVPLDEHRYEAHSLFLPEGRGREAIVATRAALDFLFSTSAATELVTKVTTDNKAARGMARLMGFLPVFTAPLPWSAGLTREVMALVLPIDVWAQRSAQARILGGWLHDRMHDIVNANPHSTLPPHSDNDPSHDQFAGAAVLMIAAGNPRKAEAFYNRYATWTGYPPIRVLTDHPCVIDLGGITVAVTADAMELLSCQ